MNESLKDWLDTNRLDYSIESDRCFLIGDKRFIVIEEKDEQIVDERFNLLLSQEDIDLLMSLEQTDYFAYKFGTKWYYAENDENLKLVELRYFGTEKDIVETFPMLGVHGGFELMNGSRSYKDWCSKAKFCQIDTLGICEESTLAGTLEFQNTCEKAGIKPIIGETVIVKSNQGFSYEVKLFVINAAGWRNLLMINACINVHNEERHVTEDQLICYVDGLICVLTPSTTLKNQFPIFDIMFPGNLYYQIDPVQWDSKQKDEEWLGAMQDYILNFSKKIPPIFIGDAYYLEKEHASLKKELNAIGKVSFKNQSSDQYFKSSTQLLQQLIELFKEEDEERSLDFIGMAIDNVNKFKEVDFKIDTGKLQLPAYLMTKEEKSEYADKDDLLWSLIEDAMREKGIESKENVEEYIERVQKEMKVICDANLQDYFLITWDILNWAHNQGITTGYGRGSAAGSLVAYLLGIVQVDPLEYDLLFERFLNEGRLYKKKKVKGYRATHDDGSVLEAVEVDPMWHEYDMMIEEAEIEIKVTGSMPDIDNDIAGERREEVKRYIEQRYGVDCVAGIGTYSALKIKSALKDLAKRSGFPAGTMEYITAAIEDDAMSYDGLFKYGLTKSRTIRQFVEDNPELIEKIPPVLNQPKTPSVHAGGIIIVPKSPNGIFEQLPVKKIDGILISEWEMGYVEQAGFLKMDILGLKQCDKFSEIIALIKENKGVEIDLKDIPLDDATVYEYFSKGFNEDVFQFGGIGLKGYTKDLMPDRIEDLIATAALYRPGPIDMRAHTDYVKRKNGGTITYPWGTEEILKETYGLLTYQEQVMKIVQHVASFTLNEADDIRKAIGKKLPELMKQYSERFITGAVDNGCPADVAKQMWEDIEGFGAYSFNKSHATCYSIMGYFSQWFKVNYPLEFWLVSLKHSPADKIVDRLAEMSLIGGMIVGGPNVNYSTDIFTTDGKKIFWSLQSIKQVGTKALEDILKERANGEFYSVTEFASRLKGTAVNRATIVNLILAGAFDDIHKIEPNTLRLRFSILQEYLKFASSKTDDNIQEMQNWENWQWILKQRFLCGLGEVNIKSLLKRVGCEEQTGRVKFTYYTISEALSMKEEDFAKKGPIVGGIITKVEEKVSRKKGKENDPFVIIEISDGTAVLSGVMWSEEYKTYKPLLKKDSLLFLKDVWIKFDDRYKKTNTFTVTKETKVAALNN